MAANINKEPSSISSEDENTDTSLSSVNSNEVDLALGYSSSDFMEDDDGAVKPYLFEPYLSDEESDPPSPTQTPDRLESNDWCRCGICRIMPTAVECKCCDESLRLREKRDQFPGISCITQHPGFQTVCLDREVLETEYFAYRQQYRDDMPASAERNRYIAYRQLVRWCWGYLGKDIRVPLPACAVTKIRETFPNENEQYKGFLDTPDI